MTSFLYFTFKSLNHSRKSLRSRKSGIADWRISSSGSGISHLGLVGAGLGGEVDEGGDILVLGQAVHELLLDVHTLTCTCRAHEQDGPVICKQTRV